MARPSLTEAERATLIRKVANGAKRSEVAKEFGCTRANVTRLCNARAVSCLTRDIAEQHEVEAIRHWLDNKDAIRKVHANVAEALLHNLAYKTPDGTAAYDKVTVKGNDAPIVRELRAELRELAELSGMIVKQANVRVSDLTTDQLVALLEASAAE